MANSKFPVLSAAKSGMSNLIKAMFAGRVPFIPGFAFIYRARFQIVSLNGIANLQQVSIAGGPPVNTPLPAALNSGTIDLHVAAPRLLFPQNVTILRGSSVRVRVNTVGLTTCTIQVGDAAVTNGLVTASNLHTGTAGDIQGRRIITPAAAEYEEHYEGNFIPAIVLVSTVNNLSVATAGQFDVRIPFRVEDG